MYIHEVVKKALETGKRFHRKSAKLKTYNFGAGICKIGTITVHNLLIPNDDSGHNCWNPLADDLIANDWEMCEE